MVCLNSYAIVDLDFARIDILLTLCFVIFIISVNESVEWGLKQVKNPCPPRKKFDKEDSIHSSEGDLNEKIDNGVEIESETRMKIGEGPDAPNENIMGKDTPGEGTTGKDITDDKSSGKFNHCEPDGPYLQPDQICPHINEPPCCVIPFQVIEIL